jgi:glycerophosphoryl diester phosphodiesterase
MDFYKKLKKQHLIAGHRGYRSAYPENTLDSFEGAIGKFDYIELDVQPSSDGRLMIFHDDTLERTTDIENISDDMRPHHLIDYDYDTLRGLVAGSWFVESGSISPQKIPTLDEALGLCAKYDMPLNIEIKDSPRCDANRLLNDVLDAIKPYQSTLPLLISSFNHKYLKALHFLAPSLSLAANVEYTHPPKLLKYLNSLGVCAYHIDEPLAETTPINELKNADITCGVFTVNDPARQKVLFDKGFRTIFADEPSIVTQNE